MYRLEPSVKDLPVNRKGIESTYLFSVRTGLDVTTSTSTNHRRSLWTSPPAYSTWRCPFRLYSTHLSSSFQTLWTTGPVPLELHRVHWSRRRAVLLPCTIEKTLGHGEAWHMSFLTKNEASIGEATLVERPGSFENKRRRLFTVCLALMGFLSLVTLPR
ncbi:hypothetical protein EV421DRAFT_452973 [Armillaria borealis]|uniref:Uncharacterized protein n=1 Tax=Armillaria borealis TaxID=47425 RepID=A0AA39K5E9_9AGAR|nr:hypothetical protein EV421DRAFT_452973 [Armillaria borealis]